MRHARSVGVKRGELQLIGICMPFPAVDQERNFRGVSWLTHGTLRRLSIATKLANHSPRPKKVRGILRPEPVRKFDVIVRKGHKRWKSEK